MLRGSRVSDLLVRATRIEREERAPGTVQDLLLRRAERSYANHGLWNRGAIPLPVLGTSRKRFVVHCKVIRPWHLTFLSIFNVYLHPGVYVYDRNERPVRSKLRL